MTQMIRETAHIQRQLNKRQCFHSESVSENEEEDGLCFFAYFGFGIVERVREETDVTLGRILLLVDRDVTPVVCRRCCAMI